METMIKGTPHQCFGSDTIYKFQLVTFKMLFYKGLLMGEGNYDKRYSGCSTDSKLGENLGHEMELETTLFGT